MKKMLHQLPVEAYTSQEWFDDEQEKIFSTTWRYAGFEEDLSEPGDYLTVQAGLNSIFIVMGEDGQLRAFHNLCRHRGTQLLRSVGKSQKSITCPYHDWTYNLEGDLCSVPEENREFGNVDKSCHGLKQASVGIWRKMLFVHPDANAPSLEKWFGEVAPHLGPHDFDDLVEYPEAATSYEIKANWKVVVENYIDVYHLAHLHSGTLAMYDHANAEYGFVGPHYAFWEPLAEHYAKDIENNTPTPLILPKDKLGAYVPMLFPGIGLAESESNWATFIITPLGPELTRVENRVRVKNTSNWEFTKQEWRSASFWQKQIKPKYDEQHEDDPMSSGDFTAEDIYACEQQQKSFQSPFFEVGPAAVGESPIIDHQKVVLTYLEQEIPTPAITPPPLPPEVTALAEEKNHPDATVSLTLKGETHEVPLKGGETILEASLNAGHKPPHVCQSGVCGACKATLQSGSCHQNSTAALSEKDIAAGKVLTCQAHPTSETIAVRHGK